MKAKQLVILAIATVIILFFAYNASRNVTGNTTSVKNSEKLLPDLQANMDNVGTVTIRSKGKSFKVHKENDQWIMPNKYNYPVDAGKIRDLVQSSAGIEIVEKRTDNPKNLVSLGLDDPELESSNAIRIALLSGDEKTTYADYIRGLNRKGVTGQRNEVYARLFKDNQAYLVRGDLNFDLGAHTLLSGETFAINSDKLQSISFNYPTHSEDNFTLGKNIPGQLDFEIMDSPGNSLKAFGKANAISSSLELLRLQDIGPAESFTVTEPEVLITYKTFNGLVLDLTIFRHDNESWVIFKAGTINIESPEDASKQATADAERINKLASPWVYKVASTSTGGLFYKIGDLVKE